MHIVAAGSDIAPCGRLLQALGIGACRIGDWLATRLGANQGHVLSAQQHALGRALQHEVAAEVPAAHGGMRDTIAMASHLQRDGFLRLAAKGMQSHFLQQHQTIEVVRLKHLIAIMHAHRKGMVVTLQLTPLVTDAAAAFHDAGTTHMHELAINLFDDEHLDVALLEKMITQ